MGKLCLGVAREIITPKIGGQLYGYHPDVFSDSIHDDLTVTAFYFKQDQVQALMLSVTVCLIETELSGRILSLIQEKTGIPKENCMLCATHTHSGPNTAGSVGWGDIDWNYCNEILIPSILSVAEKAMQNIQPVKMAVACGNSYVGINRRELDDYNNVILGQNPWGCMDPRMTILSFANSAGVSVANMIHYGAHGTAAGANHEVTRDWSGIMVDTLEKQSGAMTAFFNGPEGDIGPRLTNKGTTGDITYVREVGAMAALDAVRVYEGIFNYTDIDLAVSHKTLRIPLKKRITQEEAKLKWEDYKHETINCGRLMKEHFEEVIRSYEMGMVDRQDYEVEQTVIALGNIVFAASPYEMFSEIGMRIDRAFKTKTVLSLSNTNGSQGYFITRDAVCRGGYEVAMFLYGRLQQYHDDADYYLFQETVKHIQNIVSESEA